MKTPTKKISAVITGKAANTAYIRLPGHRQEPGVVSKTIDINSVIKGYKGPRIHLDFDKHEKLIGIEIMA